MDMFGRRFPKRTYDVGIAEQHAVTFAAGMAVEGLKPFCCIYSTFLQRAYDQVWCRVVWVGLVGRLWVGLGADFRGVWGWGWFGFGVLFVVRLGYDLVGGFVSTRCVSSQPMLV